MIKSLSALFCITALEVLPTNCKKPVGTFQYKIKYVVTFCRTSIFRSDQLSCDVFCMNRTTGTLINVTFRVGIHLGIDSIHSITKYYHHGVRYVC